MAVINDGSGKDGYYAVNEDFASVTSADISTEVLNIDYRECIDSFSCSVIKGMYDISGDIDNLLDTLEIGTNTSMQLLEISGKALKIIARPIGAIQGAQEYYNNRNKRKEE